MLGVLSIMSQEHGAPWQQTGLDNLRRLDLWSDADFRVRIRLTMNVRRFRMLALPRFEANRSVADFLVLKRSLSVLKVRILMTADFVSMVISFYLLRWAQSFSLASRTLACPLLLLLHPGSGHQFVSRRHFHQSRIDMFSKVAQLGG